ncbi:MAG: FG-GAP-like repeat-containing protein [Acidobacteriota bacterium]
MKRLSRASIAFATAFCGLFFELPATAQSTGYFQAAPSTLSGIGFDVALADLDGDSDLDAYTVDFGVDRVWLNQGGAQGGIAGELMQTPQALDGGLGAAVALGDIDGDGDVDALVGRGFSGALEPDQVWLNDGSGTFSDSGQRLGNAVALAVALADLDLDGDLDGVVVNLNAPHHLLINQGGAQSGTEGDFVVDGQALGSGLRENAAVGDLDGDGDPDLILPGPTPRIWLNQGGAQNGNAGTFVDSGATLGAATGLVALGDLDGDGDLDAFVSTDAAETVWRNDGSGTFTDSGLHYGDDQRRAQDVALGDLDGDGDLDAVAGREPIAGALIGLPHFDRSLQTVWLNEGDATFRFSGQCHSRSGFEVLRDRRLALGDLDGDGGLDAVVSNVDSLRVWWSGGESTERRCCPAELARYGAVAGGASPRRSGSWGRWLERLAKAGASVTLDSVYLLRDQVMPQTPEGPRYAALYDTHSEEIASLLFSDPLLLLRGASTLGAWLPHIVSVVDETAGAALVGQSEVDALELFLTELSAAGSPQLQQAVADELAALPPLDNFVGQSVADMQGQTIGLPGGIFSDGFEGGSTAAWSQSTP